MFFSLPIFYFLPWPYDYIRNKMAAHNHRKRMGFDHIKFSHELQYKVEEISEMTNYDHLDIENILKKNNIKIAGNDNRMDQLPNHEDFNHLCKT